MGVGLGLVMSPTNTDALNTAPDEHRGQASGVISTARQVGSTFGIATGGTIVATISNNWIVSFLEGEGENSEQAQPLERVLAESEGSQAAITATSPQPSRRRSSTRLAMGSRTRSRRPIG